MELKSVPKSGGDVEAAQVKAGEIHITTALSPNSNEEFRQAFTAARGVKPNKANCGVAAENGDHDGIIVHGIHENVVAISLMIDGVKLKFADSLGEFFSSGEGTCGERGYNSNVEDLGVPALRNYVAPLVDDDGQVGLAFVEVSLENFIKSSDLVDA
jgi:hypothetical protein